MLGGSGAQATAVYGGGGRAYTLAAVFNSLPGGALADGTTASGTSASTGTNGQTMPWVNLGDFIDVIFMSQPTDNTAHTQTVTDNLGNTYIDAGDGHYETSFNRQFARVYSVVTHPGVPTITGTYSGTGGITGVQAIGCAVIPRGTVNAITPYTAGKQANNRQAIGASPSANSQTSTTMPITTYTPAIIAGWGYCDGLTGPPTAGTAPLYFSLSNPQLWTGLSGIACLSYELSTVNSNGTYAATFNPVASQVAYSFVAAWNLIVNTSVIMWVY